MAESRTQEQQGHHVRRWISNALAEVAESRTQEQQGHAMADPRMQIKLRALRAQRDELRRRLEEIEAEIASIEQILSQEQTLSDQSTLSAFAGEVEEYLGARIVRLDGNRVNLRRKDDRGDLLCLVLASHMDHDGTWWADLGRLREYLATVKRQLGVA